MAHPMGEPKPGCLRVVFDRRLKLEFHGSKSPLMPAAYRKRDDALGLTEMAKGLFAVPARTDYGFSRQFRQST